MKFYIISPSFSNENWIRMHIGSVFSQNNCDYDHIIINSHSDEVIAHEIRKCVHDRLTVVNAEKSKALHSHIKGVNKAFDLGMTDDDVIVHLDGDDWMFHPFVLESIQEAYSRGAWATYGNYIATNGENSICRPISEKFDRKTEVYRWYFSHLRTFKAFLWKHIHPEDFLDSSGNLFPMAGDLAICCPVLEMTPLDKLVFTNQANVVYNRTTILNENKVDSQLQSRCTAEISMKQPYPEL